MGNWREQYLQLLQSAIRRKIATKNYYSLIEWNRASQQRKEIVTKDAAMEVICAQIRRRLSTYPMSIWRPACICVKAFSRRRFHWTNWRKKQGAGKTLSPFLRRTLLKQHGVRNRTFIRILRWIEPPRTQTLGHQLSSIAVPPSSERPVRPQSPSAPETNPGWPSFDSLSFPELAWAQSLEDLNGVLDSWVPPVDPEFPVEKDDSIKQGEEVWRCSFRGWMSEF